MTNDMTRGAITPLLIRFTIPLVLGNLFQLTYNAADSIIVGKFVGEEALAAVGTSNPLMTLAILFINGMCLGAGILVSTAFGAGDTQLMERQVSTTAIAGTVFSLAFSALCVILATPLLQLMQVPAVWRHRPPPPTAGTTWTGLPTMITRSTTAALPALPLCKASRGRAKAPWTLS